MPHLWKVVINPAQLLMTDMSCCVIDHRSRPFTSAVRPKCVASEREESRNCHSTCDTPRSYTHWWRTGQKKLLDVWDSGLYYTRFYVEYILPPVRIQNMDRKCQAGTTVAIEVHYLLWDCTAVKSLCSDGISLMSTFFNCPFSVCPVACLLGPKTGIDWLWTLHGLFNH